MDTERILALDIGDRRIGVAVSDPIGMTAQPVGTIHRVGWAPDIRAIADAAAKYGVKMILCGLPLNMDGSEGEQAQKARAFAQQLEKAGFAVAFHDERLSTARAEDVLIESGVSRRERKAVVDTAAAMLILQSYLGERNGG